MTTQEMVNAYAILRGAKVTKMDDADKFRVVKAMRPMKAAQREMEDFREDAVEKLKGDGHDEMTAKAQQWQREGEKTTLTEDERRAVNAYFADYNHRVEQCLRDEACKTRTAEYETLTGEAFAKLVASNDWTVEQIAAVEDALVDER